MKPWAILAPAAVVGCLAACATLDPAGRSGATASQPGTEPASSPAASAETPVFVGRFIYDPLAPNWTISERAIDAETYRLSLRAKQFRVGGDGEAMRIVKRRALQLQREKGYAGYRLLDYSEGIESATPFTYRVSEGTIQLVKAR